VNASKAQKAADRPHGGDLPKSDQLGRLICFEATPILSNFQAIFVARRYGVAPHLAAAIATLAFSAEARS
jgi:hypothetical protein